MSMIQSPRAMQEQIRLSLEGEPSAINELQKRAWKALWERDGAAEAIRIVWKDRAYRAFERADEGLWARWLLDQGWSAECLRYGVRSAQNSPLWAALQVELERLEMAYPKNKGQDRAIQRLVELDAILSPSGMGSAGSESLGWEPLSVSWSMSESKRAISALELMGPLGLDWNIERSEELPLERWIRRGQSMEAAAQAARLGARARPERAEAQALMARAISEAKEGLTAAKKAEVIEGLALALGVRLGAIRSRNGSGLLSWALARSPWDEGQLACELAAKGVRWSLKEASAAVEVITRAKRGSWGAPSVEQIRVWKALGAALRSGMPWPETLSVEPLAKKAEEILEGEKSWLGAESAFETIRASLRELAPKLSMEQSSKMLDACPSLASDGVWMAIHERRQMESVAREGQRPQAALSKVRL